MLTKNKLREIKRGSDKNKELSIIFNALSDPGRLQIFRILLEGEDVCVSDLANILGISVPAASRQLKILEQAELIKRTRKGQMVCYQTLNKDKTTRQIISMIKRVAK